MSQELANKLKEEFFKITNITCNAIFMKNGSNHQPTTLNSEQQGVYVFLLSEKYCFKVGKAGSKSQARWNSHHYNLDDSTPSTLPKSIKKDIKNFKSYFEGSKHQEIDNLSKTNIKDWIKNNISRIELVISSSEPKEALNLLEALVQFRLRPKYEGKSVTEDS